MDSENVGDDVVGNKEQEVAEDGQEPEAVSATPVSEDTSPVEKGEAAPLTQEETAGSPAEAETPAPKTEEEEPAATEPSPTPGRRWDPIWVVAVLLVVVLAALIALNRIQAAKNSGAATPLTAPTQPPATSLPTPVIKGGSVAAIVNGHKIPTSDYRLLLNVDLRSAASQGGSPNVRTIATQVLDQMIEDEIMRQYAVAHHITVPASTVNKEVAQFKAQHPGPNAFSRWLSSLGLTYSQFRSLLASGALNQAVAQRVAPAKPLPYAHVRLILITLQPPGKPARKSAAAKALATRLLHQIQHGASFAALAKKYSDDTGSGKRGGDLGKIYSGDLPTLPTINHAIFTLPLNHPAIVQNQLGYQLLEVLGRGRAVPPATSQARRTQQQQGFNTWIAQQKKRSSIKKLVTVAA